MSVIFALATLAGAVAQLATVEASGGARADASSSSLSRVSAAASTRSATSIVPEVSATLSMSGVEASGRYAPRFWTSTVDDTRSGPLATHTVDVRLRTIEPGPWSLEGSAIATRGWRDSRSAPPTGVDPGNFQLATTERIRLEELDAHAGGSLSLDARTTVGMTAAWGVSRAVDPSASALLPPRRRVSLGADLRHQLTERTTLSASARAERTVTNLAGGAATATILRALASWRHRLTPDVEGWLSAGASLERDDDAGTQAVAPTAELGIARAGAELSTTLEASAGVTTYVDRFTGDTNQTATATARISWRPSDALSVAASGHASSSLDEVTRVGVAEASATWTPLERFALTLGVSRRWQDERRPEFPSFVEDTIVARVSYNMGPHPLAGTR